MANLVRLGVDFGTSTTKVALKLPGRAPVALPVGEDGRTVPMPSVVTYVSRPGSPSTVLVGEEAERAAPAGTLVRSVKRCLGCDGGRCESWRRNALAWCSGTSRVDAGAGIDAAPEQVARLIVEKALERAMVQAESRYGVRMQDVQAVSFGCGAAFDAVQRRLIASLARSLFADHVSVSLVDEPVAAALAYANLSGIRDGLTLIFDFGGGTFDAAVVDVSLGSEDRLTVVAADGVNWLGGDDVDNMLFEGVVATIGQQFGFSEAECLELLGPAECRSLASLAKRAKEYLSSAESFQDAFLSAQFEELPISLTRSALEDMLRTERRFDGCDFVDRSLYCVVSTERVAAILRQARDARLLDYEALKATDLGAVGHSIDRVVLVGGVTRMPLVYGSVARSLGAQKVENLRVVDPISAVAIGAAYPPPREHFSILHPPYEILLHLLDGDKRVVETLCLHEAGDRLDFMQGWPSNMRAVFRTPTVSAHATYPRTALEFRRDGRCIATYEGLGLRGTSHYATVDLAGRICLDGDVTAAKFDTVVPVLHPWQTRIAEGEKARASRTAQERYKTLRARDITVYTEN